LSRSISEADGSLTQFAHRCTLILGLPYTATRLVLQLNIAAYCWSWSALSSRLL